MTTFVRHHLVRFLILGFLITLTQAFHISHATFNNCPSNTTVKMAHSRASYYIHVHYGEQGRRNNANVMKRPKSLSELGQLEPGQKPNAPCQIHFKLHKPDNTAIAVSSIKIVRGEKTKVGTGHITQHFEIDAARKSAVVKIANHIYEQVFSFWNKQDGDWSSCGGTSNVGISSLLTLDPVERNVIEQHGTPSILLLEENFYFTTKHCT
jgi:hypothetical protein